MTSWTHGKEEEQSGERQMNNDDLGDKVQGAARKVGGEIEQGVDNVRDWADGRQNDLDGDVTAGDRMRTTAGSAANDAGQWIDNRAQDLNNAIDNNDNNNNRRM